MKPTLIVTIGVSNSGKTFWSRNYIQENPNTVCVSRDKLRELLYAYTEETVVQYYQNEDWMNKEKLVTQVQNDIIWDMLKSGKDVIVDNTHLAEKYIQEYIAEFAGYAYIRYKIFEITPEVALERDAQRTRQVGEKIINQQMEKFKILKSVLKTFKIM